MRRIAVEHFTDLADDSIDQMISETGQVNVEVIVDEQGDVISAKAVSGPEIVRPLAEAAALKAKFEGITLSGIPVRVSGILIYNL